MSEPKKYRMRTTKTLANGQPVPVFYKNGPTGQPMYLRGEGDHEMTPAILRAMKAGDVEVDGYPDKPAAKKKAAKKTTKKKAAKKAPKKTEADASTTAKSTEDSGQ